MDLLKKSMNEIKEKVNDNRARIDQNKDKNEELERRMENMEKNSDRDKIMTDIRDSQAVEDAEKEARKANVVFYQFKEPDESITSGKERKNKDKEELEKIFQDIDIDVDIEEDIKFWFRSGQRTEGQDKPRPLILGFKSEDKKRELMNKAKNLAKSVEFITVSIAHDLTKRQREADTELLNTAERRNREMDDEERKNYEWKVLGPKGQRRLVRLKKSADLRKRTREMEDSGESPPRTRRRDGSSST